MGAGCAIMKNSVGSALDVRYAMGLVNHLDVLATLSSANGFSDNIINASVYEMFYANSMMLGVRGYLDFLKVCSFKLSCSGGFMFYGMNHVVPGGYDYAYGKFVFCINGMGELDFKLTPKMDMGFFYSWTRQLSSHDDFPDINGMGVTVSFKI